MNYEEAKSKMSALGQEHIFKYYDTLSDTEKAALIKQVEETDFSVLARIDKGADDKRGTFSPLAAMQRSEIEAREKELHDAAVKKKARESVKRYQQEHAEEIAEKKAVYYQNNKNRYRLNGVIRRTKESIRRFEAQGNQKKALEARERLAR